MAADDIPKVVLGVAAHPDDLDFCMAGTVAKWADAGAEVYYLILTNGDKGTDDDTVKQAQLAETRRAEQRAAARLLGVKDVFFCNYPDAQLEATMAVKRDIVRVIRTVKPEVLMTIDPAMLYNVEQGYINHPDHRAAGQAALDAAFPLARDCMSFPELLHDEHLDLHKTKTVLLMNFDTHNYSVDISKYIDKKMEALAAHASQMPNLAAVQQRLRQFAALRGSACGAEYAECFIRIDIQD